MLKIGQKKKFGHSIKSVQRLKTRSVKPIEIVVDS